ncbi:MAG: acyltransferase family protein [Dysgonamonadaceae bacterium]|jgi:fucose 4-O-acetylase-like acetyltransferase|nr:acyltransferase family protein [Dysgonamonadaceae bacterium]
MEYKIEQRQSEVIEAMRFPLIMLVIFIHVRPTSWLPVEIKFSDAGIYRILSEMISHNLGAIAVPCFFLFSGFFFFYKMKENWNFNFYLTQLKKRFRTLLIPYLIWNLLMVLAIVVISYVFRLFTLEADGILFLLNSSWYELLWSMPANYPLWYLCVCVLSFVFYIVQNISSFAFRVDRKQNSIL